MRLVQWSNGEYQTMVEEMKSCCYSEVKTKTKVRRELDRAYALVMEYVPGFALMDLGPSRLRFGLNRPNSNSIFRQIGLIAAGDLLVNNSDRIPLVWHNSGNANNLLFRVNAASVTMAQLCDPQFTDVEIESVTAIDSKCFCIPIADGIARRNYDSYLQRVDDFLGRLFGEMREKTEGLKVMEPVVTFFREFGGGTITGPQQFQIAAGLIQGLQTIALLSDTQLSDLFSHVQSLVTEDWMNIWTEELRLIRLPFLQSLRDLIAKHVSAWPAELEVD